MRKIFKNMAWTMAATLVMAACSDSLDENSGNGNDLNTDGTGYVKIALNLPSTSGTSTRADSGNDDFNDGLAAEYKVNNVILALFYGKDESSATCKWATKLNTDFSTNLSANITSSSAYVVSEVPQPDQSIFALAIVNGSGYFGVLNNELTFDATGNSGTTSFTGKTLSKLFESASNVDLSKIASTDGEGSFMMTNAPISDIASVASGTTWDPKITTLVNLKFYEDKTSAEKSPSDNIYVERVAAKVNVKINSKNNDNILSIMEKETEVGKVVFNGWILQTTNKKTYLVRNVGTAWKDWVKYYNTSASKVNRFVGEASGPYRTYWGIDPNYSALVPENDLANNFKIWSANVTPGDDAWLTPATNSMSSGEEKVAYCAENTTIAKAMQQDQLTGILLKATYQNTQGTTANIFTCNNVSTIYPQSTILTSFTECVNQTADPLTNGNQLDIASEANGAIITTVAELKKVVKVKAKEGTLSDLSDTQAQAILAAYSPIKFYKAGETFYYASLIKHFGDMYTPANNIVNLDDYNENDHLGRWGVVRNNWYELSINSVSGLGEPTIPDNPELPADTEDSYINCTINVLSWAKRSQDVDL